MPSSPSQHTIHLVERAQADDAAALNELFARFLPVVRRIAALRLGRTARQLFDVDDLTQEAMTDALRGLDRFDLGSDGKFRNWLARIVENRIRMALRAEGAEKRGAGQVQRFADAAQTVRNSQLPGHEATPSQHAIGTETNERMERGLLLVPEHYREVIIHRFFCDMSYDEIAEQMGLASTAAARAMYSSALRELRKHLGADA